MSKLNNFDKIYNKFLFEWTEGRMLSDIIQSLKQIQPTENVENSNNLEDNYQQQIQTDNKLNTNNIKSTFYQIFPDFLLHKCQTKFPLEDDSIIPNEIIDKFWNLYAEIILEKLADKTIDCLRDLLFKILIDIFGPQTQYNNDKIFNQSAMQLVKINIV